MNDDFPLERINTMQTNHLWGDDLHKDLKFVFTGFKFGMRTVYDGSGLIGSGSGEDTLRVQWTWLLLDVWRGQDTGDREDGKWFVVLVVQEEGNLVVLSIKQLYE